MMMPFVGLSLKLLLLMRGQRPRITVIIVFISAIEKINYHGISITAIAFI